MRKKLFLRLVFLTAVAFSLHSCRTEDEYLSVKETSYSSDKFQVFTPLSKEPVNYASGFRKLLEKYDSINGTGHSRSGFLMQKGISNGSYVEFSIHSQDIILENGDRWIIYPRISNSSVSGLTVAVLNKKETFVEYLDLNPASEYYVKIIDLFRLQYQKSVRKAQSANKGGNDCGWDVSNPCDIEDIIITVPQPGGNGGGPGGWGGGNTSGACSQFQNCIDPNPAGGGNGQGPYVNNNPCAKTKAIANNPERQTGINELRDKSKLGGEKGFMTKPDGTPGPIMNGGDHEVQFGDVSGYQGYTHNHTPTGVKMFSNEDIHKLFAFIIKQPAGAPIDDAFGEMIGSQVCPNCPEGYEYYYYIIRFTGLLYEAVNIYQTAYDFDALGSSYEKFERELRNKSGYSSQNGNFMSTKGLEEVFFNALDNMGIDKSKMLLQKVNQNGNVTNVILDANGKPQDIPCP
ncbi:hypothetical protein [Chryseobacterium shigense]|uniref:Uncharacterized protein n=1 Tax=Chryseobacterium shigense TaxID=297244 RepID=A0A841NL30_9FLAO|nr:hypothetical protein [Chryseobacterium shigense]MBB6371949.1 hypothetical protein [Chryseobacterium shigense]